MEGYMKTTILQQIVSNVILVFIQCDNEEYACDKLNMIII